MGWCHLGSNLCVLWWRNLELVWFREHKMHKLHLWFPWFSLRRRVLCHERIAPTNHWRNSMSTRTMVHDITLWYRLWNITPRILSQEIRTIGLPWLIRYWRKSTMHWKKTRKILVWGQSIQFIDIRTRSSRPATFLNDTINTSEENELEKRDLGSGMFRINNNSN